MHSSQATVTISDMKKITIMDFCIHCHCSNDQRPQVVYNERVPNKNGHRVGYDTCKNSPTCRKLESLQPILLKEMSRIFKLMTYTAAQWGKIVAKR
jgi:hypothetical protein